MKIALTGGGTAGHVIPHIALLSDLKTHFEKIIYIGSENGIEREIITKENIPYYSTKTTKFVRGKIIRNLAIPFYLLKGIRQAKEILKREKPDIIFSKGGFVSLPTVIAGSKLHIPVVIHESDISIGLANKVASKYANIICTSFKKTATEFKNKGIYTGSPFRDKSEPIANNITKHLRPYRPTILITGGSQGSKVINSVIQENIKDFTNEYNIIHLVGKTNSKGLTQTGYVEIEYTNNIIGLIKASDIVISRAGSNTIFELLFLKKPMILIPLPKGNSRGDQILNAEYFKRNGYAYIIQQKQLTYEKIKATIKEMMANINNYTQILNNNNVPNGNKKIIEQILNQVKTI